VIYPLQRITFPAPGGRTPELYLRSPQAIAWAQPGTALTLAAGDEISSDTYFGAFPLAQWSATCGLADLRLRISLSGAGTLRVKSFGIPPATDPVLGEWQLGDGTADIELSHLLSGSPPASAIYLVFTATSQTSLHEAVFETRDAPRRRVDLGLVVTTFRRVDAVTETIHRLRAQIDADRETALGSLRLIVVDNGEELDSSAFPGTLIIPNPNLGGAGGFARGLLHLVDEGTCSHGCFMDDDASTEEECILRTRRLLAYVTDENTAISAAMLQSEKDHIVHEQGATFVWKRTSRIISHKHGRDLLKRRDLAEVVRTEPVGYGGWWYFAFPIRADLKFPYPMFVRGDDWLFSYLNRFTILTPLGIASWQDGFAGKLSPTEQYLAFKAFLVMEIIIREQDSFAASQPFFLSWMQSNLEGYCYDRAQMNIEAIKDVLAGPGFWASNVLLGNRLATLKPLITDEIYREAPAAKLSPPVKRRRGLKRRFRKLSQNGHLLPASMVSGTIRVDKNHAPAVEAAFRHDTVDYVETVSGKIFRAKQDRPRFFRTRKEARHLIAELTREFPTLRGSYVKSVDEFCTPGWWREQFARHRTSGGTQP
jgi:GT2 family glycosyltransferase